jgi:hypothetical protein
VLAPGSSSTNAMYPSGTCWNTAVRRMCAMGILSCRIALSVGPRTICSAPMSPSITETAPTGQWSRTAQKHGHRPSPSCVFASTDIDATSILSRAVRVPAPAVSRGCTGHVVPSTGNNW